MPLGCSKLFTGIANEKSHVLQIEKTSLLQIKKPVMNLFN